MAAILARRGASAATIGEAMSADLPLGPRWIANGSIVVLGSGPGTWLAQREDVDPSWIGDLQGRLVGLASVSDQSGAYRVFWIEGSGARTLLQRGAAVDLDESAFPAGSVAFTVIAHLDVIIRRLEEADRYELAVYRSSAEAFVRWLSAARDGL
uniref:Sarcosine oxidase gamma subunit n=1 Tax=Caulobacter sp. (strain K31) TaxID=366602 RepID=B0SV21_CAUSK